jgi:hypothetical protein
MTEHDAYQRGNRDGLLALAEWVDLQVQLLQADGRKFAAKSKRGGDSADQLATSMLWRAHAIAGTATKARQLAKALPIDPEAS